MVEGQASTAGPGPCNCEEQYIKGVTPEAAEFYRLTRHLPGCPNNLLILRRRRQEELKQRAGEVAGLLSAALQDRAGYVVLLFDHAGGWETYVTNVRKEVLVGIIKAFSEHLGKEGSETT